MKHTNGYEHPRTRELAIRARWDEEEDLVAEEDDSESFVLMLIMYAMLACIFVIVFIIFGLGVWWLFTHR